MPILPLTLGSSRGPLTMKLDLDPERPSDKYILDLAAAGRVYEPDVCNVFLKTLREGDTVIDVGANIGFFTTLAGLVVGPTGRVLAVEPDPGNIARIHRHLGLNGLDNVEVIAHPLSSRAGQVSFFVNSDNNGGNALWDPAKFPGNQRSKAKRRRLSLQATTLDRLSADLRLNPPRLIKIDTEGAEQTVLEGGADLVAAARVPFVVAELHEFGLQQLGGSQQTLRRLMAGRGYATFVAYWNGALPKMIPVATHIRKQGVLNLVFASEAAIAEAWPEEIIHPKVWL